MPMNPGAGESQADFISRCVPEMMSGDREQDQAVAICMDLWRGKDADPATIVRKTTTTEKLSADLEYVLSDGTIDRLDDVLDPKGWSLDNFKRNPIALFQHDKSFPIGTWRDVRVIDDRLVGKLVPAEPGTSQRIDEIRSLIRQGILRTTSVGFRPLERKPREGSKQGGMVFAKNELLEASIVSVPANPNTLQLAKSLNISRDTVALVFGESAAKDWHNGRGPSGESAAPSSHIGNNKMATIAERVQGAQDALLSAQQQLESHLGNLDNSNVSDADMAKTNEFNVTVKSRANALAILRDAENNLAVTAAQSGIPDRGNGGTSAISVMSARPFAVPKKEIKPIDYIFRSYAVLVKNHNSKGGVPLYETLKQGYGEDAVTKGFLDIVTRAVALPADTVTSGWASQLVQTAIGEFFDALIAQTVYPGLSARGGRYTFGRNGTISLPSRVSTPTVAGAFFQQGSAIPVKQGAFAAVTLTPKKMGVITTMTREILEHSIPAIEQLLRQAMADDTGTAIDTILLDAAAATAIRPAGILNGATTAAGTAGGGIAAIVADVKGMLGTLITNTAGNIRTPVWIMNPVQAIALQLTQNAGGDFPFEAEVNRGTFRGYPLLLSTTLTAGTVILVDAADFFSATGDEPRFDVSDQAVLHMEDTAPLAIGTVGAPNVVAAPTRSLWQTDCIGIRMILDINWAFRRTGMVVARTAVTW